MASLTHFKFCCEHCGGGVEFPIEGVGHSVPCPHCQKVILLRRQATPTSQNRKLAVIATIAIASVACAVFGIHYQREREKRSREIAERSFPLSEAYKQVPPSYQEAGKHHLLGKTVGRDFAGTTAQSLDAVADVRADADRQYKALMAWWNAEGEKIRAGSAALTSMLNVESATFRAKMEMNAIEKQISRLEELKPELQLRQSNVSANVKRTFDGWIRDGRIVDLDGETRVRVLDISGHYAKVTPLEGSQANKVVFVQASKLLVR